VKGIYQILGTRRRQVGWQLDNMFDPGQSSCYAGPSLFNRIYYVYGSLIVASRLRLARLDWRFGKPGCALPPYSSAMRPREHKNAGWPIVGVHKLSRCLERLEHFFTSLDIAVHNIGDPWDQAIDSCLEIPLRFRPNGIQASRPCRP
jgi:hypothetical protein